MRVRCLHKDEHDPEEEEEKVKADGFWRRGEHYDPRSALEARYPAEFTRPVTSEMKDWVMEYVQTHKKARTVPTTSAYFCSLMNIWELKHIKDFHMPMRVKNVICRMVLASVGATSKAATDRERSR